MGGEARSPSPEVLGSTCFTRPLSTNSLPPAQGGFGLLDTLPWVARSEGVRATRGRKRLAAVQGLAGWQQARMASPPCPSLELRQQRLERRLSASSGVGLGGGEYPSTLILP